MCRDRGSSALASAQNVVGLPYSGAPACATPTFTVMAAATELVEDLTVTEHNDGLLVDRTRRSRNSRTCSVLFYEHASAGATRE
jgi:hypothetical protein